MPMTRPIRKDWLSSQLGHQRAGTASLRRAGAAIAMTMAVTAIGIDHSASARCQSPCAIGKTPTGVVNVTGRVSPIRMPLL